MKGETLRYTQPPKQITEEILKLCSSIVAGNPAYLPVRSNPRAIDNECFQNIKSKVSSDGGELIHGWTIWEWPRVLIEGEFHACWKSPEGELMDITHKSFKQILFLPDHTRRFAGFPFDNKRQALTNDALIHRFIDVTQRMKALELSTYDPVKRTFLAREDYHSVASEYDHLRREILKKYRPGK